MENVAVRSLGLTSECVRFPLLRDRVRGNGRDQLRNSGRVEGWSVASKLDLLMFSVKIELDNG
jgi:hypothetical protein